MACDAACSLLSLALEAALARRPNILCIDGLASSMVRFSRVMRATKFQQSMLAGISTLVDKMERRVVAELPSSVQEWQDSQHTLFDLAGGAALPEAQQALILEMFNGHWESARLQWYDGKGTHWCAGCCSSDVDCKQRAKQAMQYLFMAFPSEPLLYRWKHWEPCLERLAALVGYVNPKR